MPVWKIYRYEDKIMAPSMVLSDDGAFIETQPVEVVSVEQENKLVNLIELILKSEVGQAQAKDLRDPDQPYKLSQPVMLEMLKLKRWSDFEKRSLMYTLHRSAQSLNMYVTGRGPDGMWIVDNSRSRSFSLEQTSLSEVAGAIVGELISHRPVESPRLLGLSAPQSKEQSNHDNSAGKGD